MANEQRSAHDSIRIPDALRTPLSTMTDAIVRVLDGLSPSVYLYGSILLGDYRPGWSDIDILVLTASPIPRDTIEYLVGLRQTLVQETGNGIYRSFEGGMLSSAAFADNLPETCVYWGTSGERIAQGYDCNAVSRWLLNRHSVCLAGCDGRDAFPLPTYAMLRAVAAQEYDTIRQYGGQTRASLYSCGWLLAIAQSLYTLATGEVTSKTAAGEWALAHHLAPEPSHLARALQVRAQPLRYIDDPATKAWLSALGPSVERFAEVLGRALG